MLATLLLMSVLMPQRQPVPVRAPLESVLETLRTGPDAADGFASALARLPELLDAPLRELVEGAAFVAGEHQQIDCVPALLEALRRERLGRYGKVSRVRELALDALIRMRVAPPHDLLFGAGSRTHPGMLFAAVQCEPKRERRCEGLAKLLERTGESDTAHWAAAIELVCERDARVAEALLLEEWRLEVLVIGPDGARSAGPYFGRSTRCSRVELWPPHCGYSIELHDPALALVPPTVTRSSRARAFTVPFSSVRRRVGDTWRLRLCAELAPRVRPLEVAELTVTTAACDAPSLQLLVEDHVERLRAHLELLADELNSGGLLRRAADIASRSRLRVDLHDCRLDRASKLETPQSRPGVRVIVLR